MTRRRLSHALLLSLLLMVGPATAAPEPTQLAQAQPLPATPVPATTAPATPALVTPATAAEPIGNVSALTGTATVIRNKNSLPLQLQDDIYPDDTLRTASDSTLGVTFSDGTTFNLTANSRIAVDSFVYEEGGKGNGALFDVAKGTVAFVAAAVAKSGDMRISTPTTTLGIRGTTGLIEVPEAAGANVAVKLYPDADGRVGRIELNDRAGASLGVLTRGASGFAIRASGSAVGASMPRFAAVPLTIAPREITRDQGFVRQVHAAQTVGRQIVIEQRDFRRANPGMPNPNRGRLPGQIGPQGPNALPGQNRPGQPPGIQDRPGQPPGGNRPGQLQQPGQPNRTGQPQRPGGPGRQGMQQGTQPGSQQGAPPRQPRNGAQSPGGAPAPAATTAPGLRQPGGRPQQGQSGPAAVTPPSVGRPAATQPARPPGLQRAPAQGQPSLQRRAPAAPKNGKPPKERRRE